MNTFFRWAIGAALGALVAAPTVSSAQSSDDWQFGATIYGYFPTIGGRTTFPPPVGGRSVSLDTDAIIDSLQFAFMGAFEARRGQWGGFADVIYMNLSSSKAQSSDLSLGGIGVPVGANARVSLGLKGSVWTLAGTYRAMETRSGSFDLLAGARVLNVKPSVSWEFSGNVGQIPLDVRSGAREVKQQNWDFIVGARGRAALDAEGKWFVPYYIDIGTGESSFTWQAMAGVGYRFGWGDLVAAWRYTDYQMKSGSPVEELNFSGPAIAATFRW